MAEASFLNDELLALARGQGGALLAVDSSTEVLSLGLVTTGAAASLQQRALPAAVRSSESLFAGLLELLAANGLGVRDLAAMVVGLGPGSFTGLRVGLASIKGLALGSDCPVYGTSSLALAAASEGAGIVVVVRDARRASCYLGAYAVDAGAGARPLGPEQCCLQADMAAAAWQLVAAHRGQQKVTVLGDLAAALAPSLPCETALGRAPVRAIWGLWQERARIAQRLADDAAALVPRYLQASAAEVNR